jgi:peptidoglycan hydrolase-like protein with peptidoglycan-binding domain
MKARILVAATAVVAAGAVVWAAAGASPRAAAPAAPAVSTATARVTRGEVTQRVTVAGTLDYDGSYTVANHLPAGILTAVAQPGTTVRRGARLFGVSGTAAVLLYGDSPAYRDFAAGMSDGPDVRQLERNLVALGHDPAGTIAVDDHFSRATTRAIRRWQQARGLPAARRTGTIPLGQVVFLPGAMRVSQAAASAGAAVGPGTRVLTGTSTTRVVIAQVTTQQQHLARVGARVLVTLPTGGDPVSGTVARVGRVAAVDPEAAATPGRDEPSVPVTVTLRLPAAARDLDQAPVQVAITSAQHRNVLMVPVTALLAKLGGGYQVRAVEAGGTRLVEVQPGLYDDGAGTVEVTGAGLRPGMTVEVPAA